MISQYAKKINIEYSLDAGFEHVRPVQTFWNFHSIVKEYQYCKPSEEKQIILFNDIVFQTSSLLHSFIVPFTPSADWD